MSKEAVIGLVAMFVLTLLAAVAIGAWLSIVWNTFRVFAMPI